MSRRLLVINPNTSARISARLGRHVQAALRDDEAVADVCTARFGAEYIGCEASYAIAAHAVLDCYAVDIATQGRPAAVLVGCFGDPGVFALRGLCPHPVIGLAEASMREAALHGRFAIVTGGAAWAPMLQRLAHAVGLHDRLAGIHTLAANGLQLSSDPVVARAVLAQACREAAGSAGVRSVIVGGAGLAGFAAEVADDVPVPLVDSVEAGARWAFRATASTSDAAGAKTRWQRLPPELERLLG
jgi:allantoin racemase